MAIQDSTKKVSQIAHTASQADVEYSFRHRKLSAGLAAASTKKDTTVLPLCYADVAMTLKGFRIAGRVTTAKGADNTDYAGVALKYDDGAGGSATTLVTKTIQATGGTAITAGQIVTVTVDDTMIVPAGKYFYAQLTSAGNGLVLNPFDVLVDTENV